MYTKYFGFNEKPFTLTPNPRFIYLSKYHKEAFAHLLYGINSHYGFIELIGEVGTGKTTVLRTLLNQLQDEDYRTALIVNPCLTGVELLRSICHEFGLDSSSEYSNELLIEINKFLLHETAEGRTVVLVIDESQNLQPAVLEQIRLISNLETDNDKLIQIILAGQPELGALLEQPELRQLNQRIAVRYKLKSMSMLETRAYIRHRMAVAGETGGVSFSLFATRWIYLYTRGVPRMINILCDRALLIAYGDDRRRVTSGIVTSAIKELINVPQGKRLSLVFIVLIILCIIAATQFFDLNSLITPKSSKIVALKPVSPPIAGRISSAKVPAVTPQIPKNYSAAVVNNIVDQQLLRFQKEISLYDQNDVHLIAFNTIAEKWNSSSIKTFSGKLTVPDMYTRLAAKRDLKVTKFNGSLNEVLRFDIPFLVSTKISDSLGAYCFAVTSANKDSFTIFPTIFGDDRISRKDLNLISGGTYYLVWQNPGQIPEKIMQGDKSYEIRSLQILLQRTGKYNGSIDGIYSVATAKAVSDFQRSAGISQNKNVGELTLAALAKYYINQKIPSISSTGSLK
jgi:general secretion pathway protein A